MNVATLPRTDLHHAALVSSRWCEPGLVRRLAHVESEGERALIRVSKNRPDLSRNALQQTLELLESGLDDVEHFVKENGFGCSGADQKSRLRAFTLAAAPRRGIRPAAQ